VHLRRAKVSIFKVTLGSHQHIGDQLAMLSDRHYFRLVIACYRDGAGLREAQSELHRLGFGDDQRCAFGSLEAWTAICSKADRCECKAGGFDACHSDCAARRIRQLDLCVSQAHLFDRLLPGPFTDGGALTHWLTPDQSAVLWQKLHENNLILIASAESAQQQIECVQAHFRYTPTVVQAFNFPA
jgi:hypothetical protein